MLEDLEFDNPHNLFHGVRFILCGFDPISKSQVYNKLVQGGAVDVGQYGPRTTHVVVDNLTYDDPVCVAAREDGKILLNGLWVAHSFNAGMTADSTNIMYRPLRDLKGIPGAKSLVVCLTGYQCQDRDDIMTMVSLMGANFSKPLVENKVTHLICYKFEGNKYELAKRTNRIKLVNHLWLEDCLKAWELLPEADYSKSGYELEELEAEAKDSEEETDISLKKNQLLKPKQEFKMDQLDSSSSKGLPTVINTNNIASANRNDSISHPDPNAPESRIKESEVLDFRGAEAFGNASGGKPVRSLDRTAVPATVGNDIASTSRNERFGRSDGNILNSKSCNGESPRRTSLTYSEDVTGELSKSPMVTAVELNAINGVDIINEHQRGETAIGCFRTPTKAVLPHEEQCSKINENRTCQTKKTDHSSAAQVSVLSPEMNSSDTFKAASSVGGSNEIRRSPACTTPILENSTTEIRNGADSSKAFQIPLMGSENDKRESNTENEYVANREESVGSEALKTANIEEISRIGSNENPTGHWYKLVLTFTASLPSRVSNLPDSPILIIHGLFAVRTTLRTTQEGNLRVVHGHLINEDDSDERKTYRQARGGVEVFKVENKDKDWHRLWPAISKKPGDQFYCCQNDKHNYRFLYEDQEFLKRAFSLGKEYIPRIENSMKAGNRYVPGVIDGCSEFKDFIEKVVSVKCDVRFGELTHRLGKKRFGPKKVGILFSDKDWKPVDSEVDGANLRWDEKIGEKSEMLIEAFRENRTARMIAELKNAQKEQEENKKRKRNDQKRKWRNRKRNQQQTLGRENH